MNLLPRPTKGLLLGLLVAALFAVLAGPAHARRIALVIGNDNYQQVSRLDKAGNDAEAMAKTLETAGFEVSLRRDINYRKMVVAFEEFYDKVKGGDEVVVFYAGHGVQTDRGAYLLPTDVEGETQSQIEKISYSVNNVLEELDRLKSRFSLVIIDACRDNPLRSRGRSIGVSRGLTAPDVAKGQMVIFSAGRNQKALDALNAADTHPNGVFTREFLPRLRMPGRSIEAVAIEVKNAVEQLAATVKHEQRPLIVNDSVGEFFFFPVAGAKPGISPPPAAVALDAPNREDRFWDDAKAANNTEAYEAYLSAYPEGRYRGLARANLSRLGIRETQLAQHTRGSNENLQDKPGTTLPPASGTVEPGPAPASLAAPAPTPEPSLPAPGSRPPAPPPAEPGPPSAPSPGTASGTQHASYSLPNGDKYEGEVVGAMRTGQGRYTFANGDRYEGSFVDNQFLGQATMQFANGDQYQGEFKGTTKEGRGVLVFANKDRYEGQFVANQYQGQGKLQFATGESYVGDFKQGLKHGKGVQTFANKDRYEGPFENDRPHGKGVTFHANGDRFEGEHVKGVKQGTGTYYFANGDRYEGGFVDGMFSGRGRLYSASGDRYEGEFRQAAKQGQGTHYFANKDRYEGAFEQGAQHGQGTHFFANGDRYVGGFANGVRHGKGVHHFASGQTREMEFVNGAEKPGS